MKDLADILGLPDGVPRTARLVAWVQGLFESDEPPVLVGGAAVELFTGGAYTTGDLDLVGEVPAAVASALEGAGFVRRGRHWIHEEGQVFLEFPSDTLADGETAVRFQVGGCEIVVIAPEDLLAERLGAWQHWKSTVDGANAWLLLVALGDDLDTQRLHARCGALEAEAALEALERFRRRWDAAEPSEEEVVEWAQRGV